MVIVSICPAERLDKLITDWDASKKDLSGFDEQGIELIVVGRQITKGAVFSPFKNHPFFRFSLNRSTCYANMYLPNSIQTLVCAPPYIGDFCFLFFLLKLW